MEQSGFMPGRNTCNNIRLVLDMIDYNEYIFDDSFILFVDFYKAFDTVSHQFMFKTIHSFGFGNRFLRAVSTLYKGLYGKDSKAVSSCSCLFLLDQFKVVFLISNLDTQKHYVVTRCVMYG